MISTPARLSDENLVASYGNRNTLRMIARFSRDEGVTWGPEIVLRNDFQLDSHGDADFSYARVFQNAAGQVVVTYYWATAKHPHQHIAVTIWDPPKVGP